MPTTWQRPGAENLRQNLEGLARALDDPINGMAMLSKRGIKLTDEQKRMAATFVASGEKAKAQGVVFEALEVQVKGVAEAGFGGLTKSLAQAQKRWEEAFESVVQGDGDFGDLRTSLIELADTLSSPEFISNVTGFATLLSRAIINAANNVQWLIDKFSALEDKSNQGLRAARIEHRTGRRR